jgi:hypothetical protein
MTFLRVLLGLLVCVALPVLAAEAFGIESSEKSSGPGESTRGMPIGGGANDDVAKTAQTSGQDITQIREMYQKFAQGYQAKNLNTVIRTMSPQWQASDGTGVAELEETLRNSFRVFDTIQFRIEGLQVRNAAPGTYTASYSATLSGRINRLNIKHEETSSVTDTVLMTPDGPRISKTAGNVTIKAR